MNRYLRAIGFTKPGQRKNIAGIIEEGIKKPTHRAYTVCEDEEDTLLAQFEIEMGENFGISVYGQFDEEDVFYADYYSPYLDSSIISSSEKLSVEERIESHSYEGICDDVKSGAALIFRVRNSVEYIRNVHTSFLPLEGTTVTLTALSLGGTVLLPIFKTDRDKAEQKEQTQRRRKLLNAARDGDEEAQKDVTLQEIQLYANVTAQMSGQDLYSLIDTYFIPYGSECELYSVMGEIVSLEEKTNRFTGESIYILLLECNGIMMHVAISRKDLYGKPENGKRFKGIIWLHGKINFPIQTRYSEIGENRVAARPD